MSVCNIQFCPLKVVQKYGALTRGVKPNCVRILNDLKDLHLIRKIYKREINDEENYDEELKEIENQLRSINEEEGLLSYSTKEYNHCVNVSIVKNGIKIEDKKLNRSDITGSPTFFELIVLSYDENGQSKIEKQWKHDCNIDICRDEVGKLADSSLPQHHDSTPDV